MQTVTKTIPDIEFTPAPPEGQMPVLASREAPALPEPTSILNIIDRASRDPSVDVDKLDRLLQMQERVQNRQAQVEYDNAMAAAQAGMEPVRTNKSNSQTRSRYATYAALDKALRPIYSENGFSLSFDTDEGAPDGHVRIVCVVAHKGGHRERKHIDMPADGKGAQGASVMTKTHATGSAVTYGKRYLLGMIFNIAVGDDDDGNKAGRGGTAGGGGDFRPERRQLGEMSQGPDEGEPDADDVRDALVRWVGDQKTLLNTLVNGEDVEGWQKKNRPQLAKLWKADQALWKDLEKVFVDARSRTARQ